jgi:alpha-ketoglutarate-dependent 2,4-dichlorophenoxyacetate dioxygenase
MPIRTTRRAVWPLADTHAGSGRKVLFGGAHARRILGWPTAERRMLLQDLLEYATQRKNVCVHQWRPGDLMVWDNRRTLHRGRQYDIAERRELRRTTINDTPEAMSLAA